MSLLLAVCALVAYVDATVTQCPAACICTKTSFGTHLYVACGHIDPMQLLHQLNSMLSADHFTEHLTSLSITSTPLTRIPASVCKLLNLTSLNLNDNKLTELPDNCFTKLTNLATLSISGNAIVGLRDGTFDGMQSLVTLDLKFNLISVIGLRVFSNSSDLTSLRSVNLDHNRLTTLEPWWYYRCILGNETSRVNISLQFNLISTFTNKLQFHFRCEMKRPYGYLNLYRNRITHIMDVLNGWDFEGYFSAEFLCLRNFKGRYPRMGIYLGGRAYACDCTDFPVYKIFKLFPGDKMRIDVRCNNSQFLTETGQPMYVTSIPLNEFVCELSDRCPSGCRCVYRPENTTLHVYCSIANLSSLSLDLPPLPKSYVKYKLDFSNNKLLGRLEHRPYFVNTSILDVSKCGLTEITVEVLKDVSRFSVVNLRGNMLQSFPKAADTVSISASLLIGNNPWSCSCDHSWMIGWLQSLSRQISDPGDMVCRSPSRMYSRNMLKSTKEDFCVDPVKRYLIIIVSLAVAVAIVVLLVIVRLLFYKLRFKFYEKWNFHPFDRDECVGEDMDYDVFLCFNSEDENPHGIRILELLESKGYRVCFHVRDFRPGLIQDNIIQSIQRSKRTVCFVSTNFLTR